MPVQATDSPAVLTGSLGTPAADDAQEANQISSKAIKRKLSDLQTTETVAELCAETADAAATDAATRKQHAAAQPALSGGHTLAQHSGSRPDEQSQQQSGGSDEQPDEGSEESEGDEGPRRHPYGVQPWGNFYLTQVPEIRTAGGS
jgi:hypothetical protein